MVQFATTVSAFFEVTETVQLPDFATRDLSLFKRVWACHDWAVRIGNARRDWKAAEAKLVHHIRNSQPQKMAVEAAKSMTQRSLLWSKMSLPLIGATGKVLEKEPSTHIAKPAPPTAA